MTQVSLTHWLENWLSIFHIFSNFKQLTRYRCFVKRIWKMLKNYYLNTIAQCRCMIQQRNLSWNILIESSLCRQKSRSTFWVYYVEFSSKGLKIMNIHPNIIPLKCRKQSESKALEELEKSKLKTQRNPFRERA